MTGFKNCAILKKGQIQRCNWLIINFYLKGAIFVNATPIDFSYFSLSLKLSPFPKKKTDCYSMQLGFFNYEYKSVDELKLALALKTIIGDNDARLSTKEKLTIYQTYKENTLKLKCLKTKQCKSNFVFKYQNIPNLRHYDDENDNRRFFIFENALAEATTVTDVFVFMLMSSAQPFGKTWSALKLFKIINDMRNKGKISIPCSYNTVERSYTKFINLNLAKDIPVCDENNEKTGG